MNAVIISARAPRAREDLHPALGVEVETRREPVGQPGAGVLAVRHVEREREGKNHSEPHRAILEFHNLWRSWQDRYRAGLIGKAVTCDRGRLTLTETGWDSGPDISPSARARLRAGAGDCSRIPGREIRSGVRKGIRRGWRVKAARFLRWLAAVVSGRFSVWVRLRANPAYRDGPGHEKCLVLIPAPPGCRRT
jgi:hypothetical protein